MALLPLLLLLKLANALQSIIASLRCDVTHLSLSHKLPTEKKKYKNTGVNIMLLHKQKMQLFYFTVILYYYI